MWQVVVMGSSLQEHINLSSSAGKQMDFSPIDSEEQH